MAARFFTEVPMFVAALLGGLLWNTGILEAAYQSSGETPAVYCGTSSAVVAYSRCVICLVLCSSQRCDESAATLPTAIRVSTPAGRCSSVCRTALITRSPIRTARTPPCRPLERRRTTIFWISQSSDRAKCPVAF